VDVESADVCLHGHELLFYAGSTYRSYARFISPLNLYFTFSWLLTGRKL
jgi:hypothetical protein